jgi:hypothetical protein
LSKSSSSSASGRAGKHLLLLVALWFLQPAGAASQVVADPVMTGLVRLADTTLTSGTVVLHHVSAVSESQLDSVAVAPDGSFVFRLPRVPDQALEEMYFASIRHDGVMYFGQGITRPIDLDSLYVINAYDTLLAPLEGVPVTLESRSLFFEPSGSEWAVLDAFWLRSDLARTVVPREDGRVWSYPLPSGARDVAAENEMSPDVVRYEEGEVVFRAALPPGERLLVIRYFVDSLTVAIPTPGETELLNVLVREPAPTVEIAGLVQDQSILLENGATYRSFIGENVAFPEMRFALVEETPPPPVEWIAVVLALVMAGGGLVALRGGARTTTADTVRAQAGGRQALLVELARLDEQYESEGSLTAARTSEYRRRRAELMERLRLQG